MKSLWSTVLSVVSALFVFGAVGWLLVRVLKRSDDPARLIFKWILTGLIAAGLIAFALATRGGLGAVAAPFACVLAAIILAPIWAPHLGAWLARPLTSMMDGGADSAEPVPLYSIAEAKRKRGQFGEALQEVRRQLDRFPTDFAGQTLEAEILADNLHDLPGAQAVIERLCQQPGHLPQNIALALNQLADWQLKYGQDVETARSALDKIIERYPNTELAQLAAQRSAHLDGIASQLAAARDRPPIRLHPGLQNVGLLKDPAALRRPAEDLAAEAEKCVQHLEKYPLDSEARERLALLYAEHYQRLDLAADQLEQLIQHPNQPPKQVARWLNLLADLHVKQGHNYEAAAQALQRIMDLFPEHAFAETARQRLAHLRLELKGQEQSQTVKLGSYEQNLGLKMAAPYKAGAPPSS
jgi:tetratricopeptide (TPR) repeat protein